MKKFYWVFYFAAFLIFFSAQNASAVKVWIPSDLKDVMGTNLHYTLGDDGKVSLSRYYKISPGDTLILQNGLRSYLLFRGLVGTPENRITIINQEGGIVEINNSLINPTYINSVFRLQECQYVKISGRGSPGIKYGIKISYACWDAALTDGKITKGGGCHGIVFERSNSAIPKDQLTSHIEIENCEVTNVGASAISCKIDNAGNGIDGRGNSFVMEDIFLHDNYLHDVGMEGIYIGQSAEGPVWHSTINVKVYDNVIARTGFEPIQVRNALDVDVHNNVCYQASLLDGVSYGVENNGFQIERGTRGNFYNNIIMDGKNEMVHGKNKDGNVTAFLPDLTEGNLVNKMGAGIDFYNNYLDGGSETYTWDDTSDVNDFRSVQAAIYCESDYVGTEQRITNFDGNYVRNIYRGLHDPGKPKADLEFFFIKQDNPGTPEDDEDPVIYRIYDNYFSGENGMETHGTVPTLELGENQINLNLEEIKFIDPVYGKDNYCIVPGSYYYDKGTSASRPDAKGLGLSRCIVPKLEVENASVGFSGSKIFTFKLTVYNRFATSLTSSKAILMYSACTQCIPVKISRELDVSGGVYEFSIKSSSNSINVSDLNYGVGNIFVMVFDPETNYKSNEVSLSQNASAENRVLTEDKVFYSKVTPEMLGPIVGTQLSDNISWEISKDKIQWFVIRDANKTSYSIDSSLTSTTYFRRIIGENVSNVFTVKVLSATISSGTIGVSQWFVNSGDPVAFTGTDDLIDNFPVDGNAYQWQLSRDNINYFDIVGENGTSYDHGPLELTTYFRRTLKGSQNFGNVVKVNINHLKWANDTAFSTINCFPELLNVDYVTEGNFPPNVSFILELSDANGEFSDNSVVLGSSNSRPSGTINGVISGVEPEGTYRIRLNTSNNIGAGSSTEAKSLCWDVLSIQNGPSVESVMNFYPNPFREEFHLKAEKFKGKKTLVTLVDLFGRNVFSEHMIMNDDIKINPQIPAGSYFLIIEAEEERNVFKCIKVH